MIAASIERCAGIDVGKKFLAVCVMVGPLESEPRSETREYGTNVGDLETLRDWLKQEGVTHVVMESTGSYWKPVFNILEECFTVYLANPNQVKPRKGHKTDKKDGHWLAHLLRHSWPEASSTPQLSSGQVLPYRMPLVRAKLYTAAGDPGVARLYTAAEEVIRGRQ
jgi:transposase